MNETSPGNPAPGHAHESRGNAPPLAISSIGDPVPAQTSLSVPSASTRSCTLLEYGGSACPPSDVSTALAEWWKISVSTVA